MLSLARSFLLISKLSGQQFKNQLILHFLHSSNLTYIIINYYWSFHIKPNELKLFIYLRNLCSNFNTYLVICHIKHLLLCAGVGYGQMIATWSVVTYYVSLMALTVYYFFASFTTVLPWSRCDPSFSSEFCIDHTTNRSLLTFNMSLAKSSSEEYFLWVKIH